MKKQAEMMQKTKNKHQMKLEQGKTTKCPRMNSEANSDTWIPMVDIPTDVQENRMHKAECGGLLADAGSNVPSDAVRDRMH